MPDGILQEEVSLTATSEAYGCVCVQTAGGECLYMKPASVMDGVQWQTVYVAVPQVNVHRQPSNDSETVAIPYMEELLFGGQVASGDTGGWNKLEYQNETYYVWISIDSEPLFTSKKSTYTYAGETAYQQAALNLVSEIHNEWLTRYELGGFNGAVGEDGYVVFDCSGFVSYVLKNAMADVNPAYWVSANLDVLYATEGIYNDGYNGAFSATEVALEDIQPGDVIFFDYDTANDDPVDHCGIYLGNGEFAHSTITNFASGVIITPLLRGYLDAMVGIKRFLPEEVVCANQTMYIKGYTIKLYAQRDDTSEVLHTFSRGDAVTVQFTNNGNWAYVTAGNLQGYVLVRYIAQTLYEPEITAQPESITALKGDTVYFTVAARDVVGNGTLSYQWYYQVPGDETWYWATATGYNTSRLTIPATASRDGYRYRCCVTDSDGNRSYSHAALLTLTAPRITLHPVSTTVETDQNAVFTVAASGETLSYQWQYMTDSGTWAAAQADGSQTDTMTVPGTLWRSGLQYRCRVTDRNGNTAFSEPALLTVVNALWIAGGACGDGTLWQMGYDGTLTLSGKGAVESAPWAEYSDSIRSVVIGSGISSVAKGLFQDLTAECRYPAAQSIWTEEAMQACGGNTDWIPYCPEGHTVALEASVSPTCTQTGWYPGSYCSICGETLTAGESIPALGHSYGEWYTALAATCTQQGSRRRDCHVCGQSDTQILPLQDHRPASPIAANVSQASCKTEGLYEINVSCADCGIELRKTGIPIPTAAHTYRHEVTPPTCSAKGFTTHICTHCGDSYADGYVNTTLHLYDWECDPTTCTTDGRYQYTCRYCSDSYTVVDAAPGHRFVNGVCTRCGSEILSVVAQPSTQKVLANTTAIFQVSATGNGLTYQWQFRTSSSGQWQNATATGNKTATLKVSATTAKSSYQYRCRIVDESGDVIYTKIVYLYVLGVKTQPTTQKVLARTTATFSVTATGHNKTYQWQYRTSASGSWINAAAEGNTTATLKVEATAGKSSYQYRCKITDSAGNVIYTNTVTLYVLGITYHPVSRSVKAGSTATFSVTATGHNKTYQWQYRTTPTGSWKNATAIGNTTATLKVAATTGKSSYQYRCKITDSAGNVVYTNVVTLYVVGVETQPVSQTVKAGSTATFKVVATGLNKTYQWQYRTSAGGTWKNATATGNTTATLKVPATAGKNGYQYRCRITDAAGNVIYTNAVTLTVN